MVSEGLDLGSGHLVLEIEQSSCNNELGKRLKDKPPVLYVELGEVSREQGYQSEVGDSEDNKNTNTCSSDL